MCYTDNTMFPARERPEANREGSALFALNRKFTLLDSVRIPLEVSPGWTGAYLASVLAAAAGDNNA